MIDNTSGASAKVGPPVKVVKGWKRLLPLIPYRSRNGWRVRVFPGMLMVWLFSAAAGTYFSGGVALYVNDRYRNHLDGISLFDRLYPPNWPKYRIARGESLIRNGREALDKGDVATAIHLLRTGLARSPANLEGRQLLADIFAYAKRSDLAETILMDGLKPDSFDPTNDAYLRRTLAFLFQRQRDEVVIELSEEMLSSFELPSRVAADLAFAQANAYFFRGNFDQAEKTLRNFDLQTTLEGRLLSARIEWERGFQELGLVLINQLAHEFPDHPEVYRFRTEWLADSGEVDLARQVSLLRRIDRPNDLRPRLDFLNALHQSQDVAAIAAESTALLQSFPDQPEAYLLLGDFAANAGLPEIAKLAYDEAERRDFPTSGLALMRVEALIVARRYQNAVNLSHELLDQNPDWETSLAPVFNGLQSIAHYALGDRESADLYLDDFLNQRNLRAENLIAVSNRLDSVGARDQALTVLQRAVQVDPANQPALSALVKFELLAPDSPELSTHLAQLLGMRRPSPELLRQAYQTLGQDRFIYLSNREELIQSVKQSLIGRNRTASR